MSEDKKPKVWADVTQQKTAYVFGAGVTGLTAAHELVERGFMVFVVEAENDPIHPGEPLVGGLAATQWASIPMQSVRGEIRADEQLRGFNRAWPPLPLLDLEHLDPSTKILRNSRDAEIYFEYR